MKLLKSLVPVPTLLNPILQSPSALSAEHRLGAKELGSQGAGPCQMVQPLQPSVNPYLQGCRDNLCEALSTGLASSLCWILPAHHTGTGNDFLCLQLLLQPKPGPLTLSHQSTSDSRELH